MKFLYWICLLIIITLTLSFICTDFWIHTYGTANTFNCGLTVGLLSMLILDIISDALFKVYKCK